MPTLENLVSGLQARFFRSKVAKFGTLGEVPPPPLVQATLGVATALLLGHGKFHRGILCMPNAQATGGVATAFSLEQGASKGGVTFHFGNAQTRFSYACPRIRVTDRASPQG